MMILTNGFIKINKRGFCEEFTLSTEDNLDGFKKIPLSLYPSNAGRKFDVQNITWLDEYDESLMIPVYDPPLSETEQIELDNYTNLLYLTALTDLGM